jgi:protein-disulfide isomerase
VLTIDQEKRLPVYVLIFALFWISLAPAAVKASEAATDQNVLSVESDPVKGKATAKVALIEFSDYQCPFCARHVRETLPQIERDYIKTGKAKYIFRDFPVETIHPEAPKAHEAAHCAGEQGKFWEMHDRLFANQRALARNDLSNHAKKIGLDLTKFDPCLDSGRHRPTVMRGIAAGLKAGVTGTPTFVLVLTEPHGNAVRTARGIRGAPPYDKFKEAIEILLSPSK